MISFNAQAQSLASIEFSAWRTDIRSDSFKATSLELIYMEADIPYGSDVNSNQARAACQTSAEFVRDKVDRALFDFFRDQKHKDKVEVTHQVKERKRLFSSDYYECFINVASKNPKIGLRDIYPQGARDWRLEKAKINGLPQSYGFRSDDHMVYHYNRPWKGKRRELGVQLIHQCGLSGSVQERTNDCSVTQDVPCESGSCQWKLVSRDANNVTSWLNEATGIIYSDAMPQVVKGGFSYKHVMGTDDFNCDSGDLSAMQASLPEMNWRVLNEDHLEKGLKQGLNRILARRIYYGAHSNLGHLGAYTSDMYVQGIADPVRLNWRHSEKPSPVGNTGLPGANYGEGETMLAMCSAKT